jgi:hypothetical protein
MHHVKDSLPSRKPGEFRGKLPVVSESIIRSLQRGLFDIGG